MKKVIITIIILLILIAGGVAGYILFQRQQEIRSKAAPATTLNLQASPSQVNVGDTLTVSVNIDTGGTPPDGNDVSGGEVHIEFDPTVLSMTSFARGAFMPAGMTVTTPIMDNTAGTAKITFISISPSDVISGTGAILTATFEALGPGTSTVDVGAQSILTAPGEDQQNVLIGSTGTSVVVAAGAESHLACIDLACVVVNTAGLDECTVATQLTDCAVSPSPSPSPSPSASPSPSPSAGSGTNPSPSPSASPSPSISSGTGGGGTGGSSSGTSGTTNPSPTPAANLPVSGITGPTLIVGGFGALFILLGLAALAM